MDQSLHTCVVEPVTNQVNRSAQAVLCTADAAMHPVQTAKHAIGMATNQFQQYFTLGNGKPPGYKERSASSTDSSQAKILALEAQLAKVYAKLEEIEEHPSPTSN